jgi:hypothetical protein
MTELSGACRNYGQMFPWIKYIPPPGKINLPKISAKEYFNPFSKRGWRYSMTIWGLGKHCRTSHRYSHSVFRHPCGFNVLRGRKARFLVIPMSLAFMIGMLEELSEMERMRSAMKDITGPDFQDNQWGFGQVIALFLWMPLCIQLVYYTGREYFARSLFLSLNRF